MVMYMRRVWATEAKGNPVNIPELVALGRRQRYLTETLTRHAETRREFSSLVHSLNVRGIRFTGDTDVYGG